MHTHVESENWEDGQSGRMTEVKTKMRTVSSSIARVNRSNRWMTQREFGTFATRQPNGEEREEEKTKSGWMACVHDTASKLIV